MVPNPFLCPDQVYLAMAKGGLNPYHILICPVAHHMSYVDCPDDTKKEIQQYKVCLKNAFKADGKNVVFFERNYRSNHLQIQASAHWSQLALSRPGFLSPKIYFTVHLQKIWLDCHGYIGSPVKQGLNDASYVIGVSYVELMLSCVFLTSYKVYLLFPQVVPVPNEVTSDTIKKSFFGLANSHTDKFGKPNPLDLAEIPKRAEIHQVCT